MQRDGSAAKSASPPKGREAFFISKYVCLLPGELPIQEVGQLRGICARIQVAVKGIECRVVEQRDLLKPYIADVKSANRTNNDEEIKNLLNELTDILQSMDNYIANHRDKEDDIKMMAEYYIPEMLSHLRTYQEMCSSKFKSKHEEAIKYELIDTIKMITDAFSTVLSEFYDNMALNTSSSLEALKASIKMKGYVK